MARATAAAWPAITVWSGEFRLAALTTSPWAACSRTPSSFSFRQLEQRGHGAHAGRHGFLHIPAALADQPDGVGEPQTSGRHQRRILTEAVAGDVVGRQPYL